ncbi:MAG: histidine kinase [Bacteroidota bacterium]
MWFATNAGVCSYDGHNFKTYSTGNGFTDYGAFHMMLDKKGRLWFFTFTGHTCYYANGKFHPFQIVHNNDTLKITWLDETKSGDLLISTFNGFVACYTQNLHLKWIQNVSSNSKITSVWSINDSLSLAWQIGSKFYIENGKKIDTVVDENDFIYFPRFLKLRDGRIIYTNRKGINLLENKTQKLVLPFKKGGINFIATCLYEDKEGNLWVGNPEGVYCFKNAVLDYRYCKKHFPTIHIMSVFNDKEGNYWFTTQSNGVLFVPDIEKKVIPNKLLASPLLIKHVKKIGKDLVFIDEEYNSYFFANNCFVRTKLTKDIILNINYRDEQGIWVRYKKHSYYYSANNTFKFRIDNDGILSTLLIENPNSILLIFYNIYKKYADGKTQKLTEENQINTYADLCIKDTKGNIWFSSINGLSYFNGKDVVDITKNNKAFNARIMEMEADKKGNVWMASTGNGLFCFKDGQLVRQLNKTNSIIPNNCKALHIDDDNNIWICTNYGLYKLSSENTITTYSTYNTLPDNEVDDVCVVGDTVYAVTPKGIAVFNKSKPLPYKKHPPKTFITNITINSSDTDLQKKYILSYYQNNIKISYTGISYSGGEEVLYQYKLEPLDTNWYITTHDLVEFSSLNPGEYNFLVRSFIAGQMPDGNSEAIISFEVMPAFWQTWWFKGIVATIILIIIYFIALWFWKKQNHEIQLKRKIVENELKALRAQINPHFLFNSLNSIQEFILYNQPEEASIYLNKFATLMRMIIEYSKQNLITLEDENKFLSLYLQLEQLRFNNSFSFVITDNTLAGAMGPKIPPMVLQPIVENAVKHGMAGKKEGGIIKIEYTINKNNQLCCKVSDNGQGRKDATHTKATHTPVGLKNIEERLKLLGNEIENNPIIIIDLFNENGPSGTCVEVLFPLITKS